MSPATRSHRSTPPRDVSAVWPVLAGLLCGLLSLGVLDDAVAQPAPKQGGTLQVALHLEPTTLDPQGPIHATGVQINKVVFERLVKLDQSGVARPLLATAWET